MTYSEWVLYAYAYNRQHSEQRLGQAFFNALYEIRPELADSIRATPFDPFYNNDIEPFLVYVLLHW